MTWRLGSNANSTRTNLPPAETLNAFILLWRELRIASTTGRSSAGRAQPIAGSGRRALFDWPHGVPPLAELVRVTGHTSRAPGSPLAMRASNPAARTLVGS